MKSPAQRRHDAAMTAADDDWDAKRYRLILELTRCELDELAPECQAIWKRLIRGGWYTDDLEAMLDAVIKANPKAGERGRFKARGGA